MANYSIIKKGKLTAMKTDPENIILKAISTNVCNTQDYGINGGFFWESEILSMAVNDFKPVRGNANEADGGWFNAKYNRGTIIFDKMMATYEIPIISSADQIVDHVVDKYASWAQGGISMSLQNDQYWQQIAVAQHMPNMTGLTTRTGMVYDNESNLWLIASTATTALEFRNLVKSLDSRILDGIFLDGGGSTQMKCYGTNIRGDGRSVYQMVALIDK
jgi:hypothetical protein